MSTDNAIEQLKNHLSDSIVSETRFLDEVTLGVRKENLKKILIFFKESVQPQYEVLMDLTGVDYLTPTAKTQVIYWLHNPTNFSRLRIVVDVAREESLPTVTDLWGGANWYERELYDLFGVKFEGHPDLTRLLMPDDWQGHPLRRDYALTEQPVQFKHQVKPKVPSEIIAGTVKNKNFK